MLYGSAARASQLAAQGVAPFAAWWTQPLGALDVRHLACIRQAIEPAKLRHPSALRAAAGAGQRLLESPAELLRVAARFAIQVRASGRQSGIDTRTLEQQAQQLRRKALGKLPPQQPVAGDVLVDLRLHLQLEQRHRLVVSGIPGNVQKMSDPLARRPLVP